MIRTIYGSSEDWINLRLSSILEEQRAKGFEVREVDCKDLNEQEVLASCEPNLFDTDPLFVVLLNPTKLKKLSNVLESLTGGEVLVVQRNDRLPKALESYPFLKLDEPKYDNEKRKWAVEFLVDFLKGEGFQIKANLAEAIVKRVGTDLGVLRWEAKKYMMCWGGSEPKEILPAMVSGCISELSEIHGAELVEAVASGDMRSFLKLCQKIENTSSTDQTMAVCNGLLLFNLVQWIEIGLRLEKKQTPATIAEDTGKNPWFVENILIPKVKALGLMRIRKLLKHLYLCEDAVRMGAREPWVKFKAGVVKVFSA